MRRGGARQRLVLGTRPWGFMSGCVDAVTLRFLVHLASLKAEQLHVHYAVVAAYESVAIREMVMASWQTALVAGR